MGDEDVIEFDPADPALSYEEAVAFFVETFGYEPSRASRLVASARGKFKGERTVEREGRLVKIII